MIVVVDNYDSFTYNLVNMLKVKTKTVVVHPDDVLPIEDVTGVVISPGPGHPLDNQQLMDVITTYHHLPILGICLGAQALTCYYGGDVIVGQEVMHGKVDMLFVRNHTDIYEYCPNEFNIMRYHSLISDYETFPDSLVITAETKDAIQSFRHEHSPHFGIQYHPESFASEYGVEIIEAFLKIVKEYHDDTIKKADAAS